MSDEVVIGESNRERSWIREIVGILTSIIFTMIIYVLINVRRNRSYAKDCGSELSKKYPG